MGKAKSPRKQARRRLLALEKPKAKERLEAGQKSGGRGHKKLEETVSPSLPEQDHGEALEQVAAAVGLSKSSRKQRKRRLLTRIGVARVLKVSRPTVERLIAEGRLRPVGKKNGRAHLYDPGEVRALRQTGEGALTDAAIVRDFTTSAEDFRDRTRRLGEVWVRDTDWIPQWRAVVRWHGRQMQTWPARIATVVVDLTREEGLLLDALPSGPHDIRQWVTIPLMRPLLEELQAALEASPELAGLEKALRVPSMPPVPAPPVDVAAARAQWRSARSDYREARVAIRRGHHRYEAVESAMGEAIEEGKRAWWRLGQTMFELVGDTAQVQVAAERVREETLARLDRLGGLVPAESVPVKSPARRTKTKAKAKAHRHAEV